MGDNIRGSTIIIIVGTIFTEEVGTVASGWWTGNCTFPLWCLGLNRFIVDTGAVHKWLLGTAQPFLYCGHDIGWSLTCDCCADVIM